MKLSLLEVTFSSTIISRCTRDFGCAGGDSGSALQHWQNASDDYGDSARDDSDSDSDDSCHGPMGHGESMCCCIPTHSPPST